MVRHGETPKNAKGELTGTLDVPLNGRGVRQAAAIGVRLADLELAGVVSVRRIYTSTMERTRKTAEIVASTNGFGGVPLLATPVLDPRHYGDLQGQDMDAALRLYNPDEWQAICVVPD